MGRIFCLNFMQTHLDHAARLRYAEDFEAQIIATEQPF
jgi:hypothetical protein